MGQKANAPLLSFDKKLNSEVRRLVQIKRKEMSQDRREQRHPPPQNGQKSKNDG